MPAGAHPSPQRDHLALWTGLTVLFTNLAAINLIALLGAEHNELTAAIAALISALAAAGAVYAKQKRDDERARRHPE